MKYFQTKESDKEILIFSQDRKRISHSHFLQTGKEGRETDFWLNTFFFKKQEKKNKEYNIQCTEGKLHIPPNKILCLT